MKKMKKKKKKKREKKKTSELIGLWLKVFWPTTMYVQLMQFFFFFFFYLVEIYVLPWRFLRERNERRKCYDEAHWIEEGPLKFTKLDVHVQAMDFIFRSFTRIMVCCIFEWIVAGFITGFSNFHRPHTVMKIRSNKKNESSSVSIFIEKSKNWTRKVTVFKQKRQ